MRFWQSPSWLLASPWLAAPVRAVPRPCRTLIRNRRPTLSSGAILCPVNGQKASSHGREASLERTGLGRLSCRSYLSKHDNAVHVVNRISATTQGKAMPQFVLDLLRCPPKVGEGAHMSLTTLDHSAHPDDE